MLCLILLLAVLIFGDDAVSDGSGGDGVSDITDTGVLVGVDVPELFVDDLS